MITIFTIPKPFEGHAATIQTNAIKSWIRLKPSCEVILCGDEKGIADFAINNDLMHLKGIECNEYGTPFLHSAFSNVSQIANYPTLCFVNSDIIFLNDLIQSVQNVFLPKYLMLGRRLNVDINQKIDFDAPNWSDELKNLSKSTGEYGESYYIDYFVFPNKTGLEKLPPFLVGRPRWDNWFVFNAIRKKIPVIDATKKITAIHQNHDYNHIPQKSGILWQGPEAEYNFNIAKKELHGSAHIFTILDSTHIFSNKGIKPALRLKYLSRRITSYGVIYPKYKYVFTFLGFILTRIKNLKKIFR